MNFSFFLVFPNLPNGFCKSVSSIFLRPKYCVSCIFSRSLWAHQNLVSNQFKMGWNIFFTGIVFFLNLLSNSILSLCLVADVFFKGNNYQINTRLARRKYKFKKSKQQKWYVLKSFQNENFISIGKMTTNKALLAILFQNNSCCM